MRGVYVQYGVNLYVCRRDLPNNSNAVLRLSPELKDLLDKMFDVKQVGANKPLHSHVVPCMLSKYEPATSSFSSWLESVISLHHFPER